MTRKTLLSLALAAATATAASVPAAPFKQGTDAAEALKDGKLGFVSMPLERREHKNVPLRRRDNDVPLFNISSISYLIELSIGTPGQLIKVAIDTGSDELWVNPDCSTSGSVEQEQECYQHGEYDPNTSSTSFVTDVTNYIPYGKGEVKLQYVYDNMTLSNSTLEISQQIFGVALASNDLNEGILGLSYGLDVNLQYPNFVDELFLQNQTNTRAFSIALGSKDFSNGGTLIFGGVDTKKFTGDLQSAPILPPQNGEQISRYWVELTGVGYNKGDDIAKAYPMTTVPVVLDSGSTLSYLPSDVVTAMSDDLGGQYDSRNDLYFVDCSIMDEEQTMDFTFAGNITIKVPLYEFIWEADTDTCVLGAIGVGSTDVLLLGDSVMRAGYFVFDQDNGAIHMAQYANCGENEKAIATGGIATEFSGECTQEDVNDIVKGGGSSSGSSGSGSSGSGGGSDDENGSAALTGNFSLLGVLVAAAVVFVAGLV